MATEASLPAPAGDLGVLLRGRLLLLPASVCQPAEVGGQTQTAVTRHTLTERRHLDIMCGPAGWSHGFLPPHPQITEQLSIMTFQPLM